jgi:hypothetical protein
LNRGAKGLVEEIDAFDISKASGRVQRPFGTLGDNHKAFVGMDVYLMKARHISIAISWLEQAENL